MLERLVVDLEVEEGMDAEVDNALNDKVNDAYGLMFAFACFVSPLIGTAMNTSYDQRTTCDIIAFFNFGFVVVLFLFNAGPFVFSENARFNKKLEELRAAAEAQEENDTDHNKIVRSLSYAKTDFAGLKGKNDGDNSLKNQVMYRRKSSMHLNRIANGRMNMVETP